MKRIIISIILAGVTFVAPAKDFTVETTLCKEGRESLRWNFRHGSVYEQSSKTVIDMEDLAFGDMGISLWIYNPAPSADSLVFEFLTPDGETAYTFPFYLKGRGWRACWTGFADMEKLQCSIHTISSFRIVPPRKKGEVILDRIVFPVGKVNERTVPDEQMPHNNSNGGKALYHWCRTLEWSRAEYDTPVPSSLSREQKADLDKVRAALDFLYGRPGSGAKVIKEAKAVFERAGIRKLRDGGYAGVPIVDPDEKIAGAEEFTLKELETMLYGFAIDYLKNGTQESLDRYFLVWAYALDQGFAYGSGMGTNHHYGYKLRNLFASVWLMKDRIRMDALADEIFSTVRYWSSIGETATHYEHGRDAVVDAWNTLLLPRTVAALLSSDDREAYRDMVCLSRWISESLMPTPGTVGGIKVDGTAFHHGGFYPAYTSGAIATLGKYIGIVNGTSFQLDMPARKSLRSALIAMRNYSNKTEWGIGIGGRHPFTSGISREDIHAFATLSLAGDLSGKGGPFDRELASIYLSLCDQDSPEARFFRMNGVTPASSPAGFFVYNYGSAGIFRGGDWMVTLKGYNTDVWGAEIYTADNRYGRYQSYGSAQIMSRPTREAGGYRQEGWDWNRLPGVTSIHLPLELLDSPLPGTTMAKSAETYSGASSLAGRYGMFSMKLMERELERFTPDFKARKSVFCFSDRMVFIGTGISDSNSAFGTETTLFQNAFDGAETPVMVDGNLIEEGAVLALSGDSAHVLTDGYGNTYLVPAGNDPLTVRAFLQKSRNERNRKENSGVYASAVIDHGKAPSGHSYEYCVLLQSGSGDGMYRVVRKDDVAHIIEVDPLHLLACSFFEDCSLDNGLVSFCGAETMVMILKNDDGSLEVSVCDPDLNISEKTFTTAQPSRAVEKRLVLRGNYRIEGDIPVTAAYIDAVTEVSVSCVDGQPVEFRLVPSSLSGN